MKNTKNCLQSFLILAVMLFGLILLQESFATSVSADDISNSIGFVQSDVKNSQPLRSYNNGVIYVPETNVVLTINGTLEIPYSFLQSGYTASAYYEGQSIYNYTLSSNSLTLTGVYPGKSCLMLYYSKYNGTTLIDEGAVLIDIWVRPNEGYVYFKNVFNGRYADVAGGVAKEGAKVIMWSKHTPIEANQVWKILPNNEGTCMIRSELGSGYYLSRDASTNQLKISTTPSYWVFQYNPSSGNYNITSPDGRYHVHVKDDATSSGAYLYYTNTTSQSKKWLIQYQSSYYPVNGISITTPSNSSVTMNVGDTLNLAFQFSPTNASCKDYTLNTTNSNIVSIENTNRIVAQFPGNATITVKTKSGGKTDTLSVNVVNAPTTTHQGTIDIGIAAEDYNESCAHDSLGSSHYSFVFQTKFIDYYLIDDTYARAVIPYSNTTKKLFLPKSNGGNTTNADDFDLMIFIGHGIKNKLHFLNGSNGGPHSDAAGNDDFNFSYTEAKFGESGGPLKWFFAYTCNFLTVGEGYADSFEDLYQMFEGAHIVLGGGTTMVLNKKMAEEFSYNLNSGETIINSFFNTMPCQSDYYTEPVIFRAVYALEARNDTLYQYASNVKGYSEGERYGVLSLVHTP